MLRRELGEVMAVKGNHEMEMSRATQREQQMMLDLADLRNDRDRLLREKELLSTQFEEAQRELKSRNSTHPNQSSQSYYHSTYNHTSTTPTIDFNANQ